MCVFAENDTLEKVLRVRKLQIERKSYMIASALMLQVFKYVFEFCFC